MSDDAAEPTYTTTTKAGAALGVHPATVRRWVRNAWLPKPPWTMAQLKAARARGIANSPLLRAYTALTENGGTPSIPPLTAEQRETIRRRYSDWTGAAMTVNAICTELGITRAQFAAFRSEEGFVHASEPFTLDEMATEDEDDLVDSAVDMARSSLAAKAARAKAQAQREDAAKWGRVRTEAEALIATLADRCFPVAVGDGVPRGPALAMDSRAGNILWGHMLVLHPTDLHYGKRGAALLGPGAYNRATARRRLFEAFAAVWGMLPGDAVPERVVLFTGSDGCHIDSAKSTTTKGTPQDTDGTAYEIAVGYTNLMFDAVEWVRARGVPVDVRVCPGNHDKFVSRIVHAAMQSAYAGVPGVVVHPSMAEYQCFRWGSVAVMTTHGDGRASSQDLAQVFSTQFAEEWGAATQRVVLRGNLHHTMDEEAAGIRNMLLPSLSGTDEYHAIKWPVSGRPSLRAPLLHAERGLVAVYEWADIDKP